MTPPQSTSASDNLEKYTVRQNQGCWEVCQERVIRTFLTEEAARFYAFLWNEGHPPTTGTATILVAQSGILPDDPHQPDEPTPSK